MNLYLLTLSVLALLSTLLPHAASLPPQDDTGVSSKNRVPEKLSIQLVGDHGKYYTGNVSLGNGKMEMRMLVDSSSSDTWFASTWCTETASQCGNRRYDCTPQDACYQTSPDLYTTRFGFKRMDVCYDYPTGCITATVATVPMSFKGPQFSTAVTNTVGMLNSSTDILHPYGAHFDGILGMGRPENLNVIANWIPPQKVITPFEQLLLEMRSSEEFYVYLHQGKGMLDLGGPDSSHYQKKLKTYKGASRYLWTLLADKIKFDKFEWMMQPCEFNTGWPYIGIPKNMFAEVINDLGAFYFSFKYRWVVSCPSETIKYPTFYFTFNGDTYALDPSMYINTTGIDNRYCRLLLADSGKPYWILGIPWFEKYYTGFSFPQNTISLALSAPLSSKP